MALGFIAVILQVPIEAGAIAESGVAGMLDPFMQEIVWQSVIGEGEYVNLMEWLKADEEDFGILEMFERGDAPDEAAFQVSQFLESAGYEASEDEFNEE